MNDATEAQTAVQPGWETRSQDELQSLLRAGFSAGADYDLAMREIERRARAETLRAELDAEAEIRERENKVSRLALTAATMSVVIAIGALTWILLKLF